MQTEISELYEDEMDEIKIQGQNYLLNYVDDTQLIEIDKVLEEAIPQMV